MRLHYNRKNTDAQIKLPASKSISNRLLVLKEVLKSNLNIRNLSEAQDTKHLVKALNQIRSGEKKIINVGDAGTDMRFLTALLAVTEGNWKITGSARMLQRPIGDLVDGLRQLGADIEYAGKKGFPPLKIVGRKLDGGTVEMNSGTSSQFISALLLIAPSFSSGFQIKIKGEKVSWAYVNMTMEILREFGFRCAYINDRIVFPPSQSANKIKDFHVEPDWSAASYFFSLVALSHSAKILLKNMQRKSLQGDRVLGEIYKQFGVRTVFSKGDLLLTKTGKTCKKFEYDFTDCPDLAQTVAVTCFGLNIPAKLTGLSTLKNKETDRIHALKMELEKLGAKVKITKSSLSITPGNTKPEIRNTKQATWKINTYGDHRMAMSFAPLALLQDITVENPKVVRKSFPSFWKELRKAGIIGK